MEKGHRWRSWRRGAWRFSFRFTQESSGRIGQDSLAARCQTSCGRRSAGSTVTSEAEFTGNGPVAGPPAKSPSVKKQEINVVPGERVTSFSGKTTESCWNSRPPRLGKSRTRRGPPHKCPLLRLKDEFPHGGGVKREGGQCLAFSELLHPRTASPSPLPFSKSLPFIHLGSPFSSFPPFTPICL